MNEIATIHDLKMLYSGKTTARAQAQQAVKQNPGSALAVLADNHRSSGRQLARFTEAKLLEDIVDLVDNDRQAEELLDSHLTHDHLVELLAVAGDLPRTSCLLAPADAVFSAMLTDLQEVISAGFSAEHGGIYLMAWAYKLCDRDDWPEFLDRLISDSDHGLTLKHHLIAAAYSQRDEGLLPDLGIDLDDAEECLEGMKRAKTLPKLDEAELEEVKRFIAERQQALRQQDQTISEQLRQEMQTILRDQDIDI